jgi:hypothetical protein
MRATNDKLGERYILVVARELSKALKALHDAGIMHRDIKGKLCHRHSLCAPLTVCGVCCGEKLWREAVERSCGEKLWRETVVVLS